VARPGAVPGTQANNGLDSLGFDGFPVALPPRPPYTSAMITKLYWATRILGYVACLGGIFYYLAHLHGADPTIPQAGLRFVYAGFLCFFVSYALRAWLRLAPRKPDPKSTP
jgi:hypothetical protein